MSFGFGLLVFGSPALGEILRFRDGSVAHLDAVVKGQFVRVELSGRRYRLPRSAFREIVSGLRPEDDWPAIASRGEREGPGGRLAAARWAVEHGLVDEATEYLRKASGEELNDSPTARLVELVDRLDRPAEPADLRAFRPLLPGRYRVLQGPRLVLIHDSSDSEAEARLRFLESVYRGFFLGLADMGLDPKVPGEAQTLIWCRRRSDFEAFLKAVGASQFANGSGYHHPRLKVVCILDPLSDFGTGHVFEGESTSVEELQLRVVALQKTLGIWAHELVHRLVAASSLCPRGQDYPGWLHEGLAMQFEAVRGDRWAGLRYPSPLRLHDWTSMDGVSNLPADRLGALLAKFPTTYQRRAYATAWKILYDLRTTDPGAFVSLLRDPSGWARSPDATGSARTGRASRFGKGDESPPLPFDPADHGR